MLNFDTASLFIKPISIHEVDKNNSEQKPSRTELRFFPEGGCWIANLPATMAFKATDAYGFPQQVRGSIKDKNGNLITAFHTAHDGMGKVQLDPLAYGQYFAEWYDENKVMQKTDLPVQQQGGINFQVQHSGEDISFAIRLSEEQSVDQKLYLVAQMYNQLAYRANIVPQTTMISGVIPTKGLITGMLTLTLFDQNWKPVAERLVFINKGDYFFKASLSWKKKDLEKRGWNEIEIEVPDTLRSNMSIAVIDGELGSATQQDDIASRLLLTSELRGYIHNPAYYFSSQHDSVKTHLDLLMLTNGWRKYNWDQLAQGKLPAIKHERDQYLRINGQLNASAELLKQGAALDILMIAKDSSRQFLHIPVSVTGSFATEGLMFYDTVKLYYQFKAKGKQNRVNAINFNKRSYLGNPQLGIDRSIVTNRLASNSLTRSRYFETKRIEVLSQYEKKMKVLDEVVVRSKTKTREQEIENKYVSGLFQTGNSRSFNIMDDPISVSFMNVLNYLQGRVAGLEISGSGSAYQIFRRGEIPALFLDEMPVEVETLTSIAMSEIAYVKVMDPPFIGSAGNGVGGAISVYTKKGGDNTNQKNKGLDHVTLTGYSYLKEFYAPDYATSSPLHDLEDVRSTIYWKPYILLGKQNKKALIGFYNNDLSKSLKVILEGLNEEGQLIRIEQVIR